MYSEKTHPEILKKYGLPKQNTIYIFALKWTKLKEKHTIHGLWPERPVNPNCADWQESELNDLQKDLLDNGINLKDYLSQVWESDLNKDNVSFWKHEYQKHGKCMPEPWYDLKDQMYEQICNYHYLKLVLLLYYKHIAQLEQTNKKQQIEYHYDLHFNLVEERNLD